MIDQTKLQILTESAKFDVSCSSSGSHHKGKKNGVGNTAPAGVCHSFTPDGRCISLLKILLSNDCAYDCRYCGSRRSADVPRATATPEEICELVMEFYKRNYIEGLFLSSAVHVNPDYTMERLLEIAMRLRKLYNFHGYIHVKGIPHADQRLVERTARYADRMSFNVELPSEKSLQLLAPQKTKQAVITPMRLLSEQAEFEKSSKKSRFLPAGQTTQMIVGASPETDGHILRLTEGMYKKFSLKRVYFSSFVPVVKDALLPTAPTGLLREHRLYQADWLLRFYGFRSDEIIDDNQNLDMEVDPKCAWALRNIALFPVEVNTAPLDMLLRVPGIGLKSAAAICTARKYHSLDYDALQRMRVVLKRARHFITANGKFYGAEYPERIHAALSDKGECQGLEQLSLFSLPEIAESARTGQV